MAFHIHCPNGHLLEIDDAFVGRKVRCPHCQAILRPQAPAAAPVAARVDEEVEVVEIVEGPPTARRVVGEDVPAPRRRREEEDYDDYDEPVRERPSKMKKATRMRLTSVGLAFHAGKILCYLIGILCVVVAIGVLGVGASSGSAGLAIVALAFLGIFMLLWVLAPVLGTIGSMLCMWVPEKTGAKVLIIISFALDALGLLIYLGCQLVSLLLNGFALKTLTTGGAGVGAAGDALGVLALCGIVTSSLLVFVAWILFMLFLRRMLLYFRESGFAHDCQQTMIFAIGLALFTPLYFFGGLLGMALVARAVHPAVGGLGMLLLLIIWIVCWINLLMKILNQIVVVRGRLRAWA